jgi:Zn-dependent protease
MKTLLVLLSFFKPALLGEFFIALGSIVASLVAYASVYGWYSGVGLVGLILIHELGHYFAAKQKNLPVGLPIFIPFLGAGVKMKEKPVNAEIEAYLAYAGPFVGTVASFFLYYWFRYSGNGFALALAHMGFLLNLFNLLPLSPLDGGRITAVISPRLWLLGVPLLVGVWLYHPSPLLILIAIFALPQVFKAWHYDPQAPENKIYYGVKDSVKFEYAVLYLALVIVLALMVYELK